jgi:hypothetical protein
MPEVACLMLTSVRGDVAPFDAIMADAAGCLLKPVRRAGPGRRGASRRRRANVSGQSQQGAGHDWPR